ncbi:MAG: hypothetical protein A2X46_09320 [Lentisphaerae bacterium GWF2_57_35]|nr:MAG: hypothetical protein A2X46_09320 [Lentisphaerae bacterium GWF2_57_35]
MGVINILLVDDHEVVRSGLRSILGRYPRIRVIGEAAAEEEAIRKTERLRPDVLLLDLRLKVGSGLAVCRAVKTVLPSAKVLVLTAFADDDLVWEAIAAGADGYILKEIGSKSLYTAICKVHGGKPILDILATARLIGHVRDGVDGLAKKAALLSPQERRLIAGIAEGKTNKEIGRFLGLSEKTVKNYLSHAFEKMNVSRRSQLAALYSKYPNWFADLEPAARP